MSLNQKKNSLRVKPIVDLSFYNEAYNALLGARCSSIKKKTIGCGRIMNKSERPFSNSVPDIFPTAQKGLKQTLQRGPGWCFFCFTTIYDCDIHSFY